MGLEAGAVRGARCRIAAECLTEDRWAPTSLAASSREVPVPKVGSGALPPHDGVVWPGSVLSVLALGASQIRTCSPLYLFHTPRILRA